MKQSAEDLESEFTRHLFNKKAGKAILLLAKHPKLTKFMGAAVWARVFSYNERVKNCPDRSAVIDALIKHKAQINTPPANSKRVTASSEYTLILAIKNQSKSTIDYILGNPKISLLLLNHALLCVCLEKDWPESVSVADALLKKGAEIGFKQHRAMYNAAESDNKQLVSLLKSKGGLLNSATAVTLYCEATDITPYEYMVSGLMDDLEAQHALLSLSNDSERSKVEEFLNLSFSQDATTPTGSQSE